MNLLRATMLRTAPPSQTADLRQQLSANKKTLQQTYFDLLTQKALNAILRKQLSEQRKLFKSLEEHCKEQMLILENINSSVMENKSCNGCHEAVGRLETLAQRCHFSNAGDDFATMSYKLHTMNAQLQQNSLLLQEIALQRPSTQLERITQQLDQSWGQADQHGRVLRSVHDLLEKVHLCLTTEEGVSSGSDNVFW